ncbi:H-NS family nucleoid-associated regulatory protein [Polaromonas sp.]|uniref:H-NS histone family protein n=1 Tax=Polaromonas sp. TaxID=1869339 RepID=UPI00375058B6
MSTLDELQQQINQAEAEVNKLRKKLAEQKNSERTQAIASAKELITLHQLTVADLGLVEKKAAPRKGPRVSGEKHTKVAPKYQDPTSGKTWTGRGKTPAWLAAYLTSGHVKQDYLIK